MKTQKSIYSDKILKNMSILEDISIGRSMFQELYPEIEKKFWKAFDSNDVKSLLVINEKLNKLIDHKLSVASKLTY